MGTVDGAFFVDVLLGMLTLGDAVCCWGTVDGAFCVDAVLGTLGEAVCCCWGTVDGAFFVDVLLGMLTLGDAVCCWGTVDGAFCVDAVLGIGMLGDAACCCWGIVGGAFLLYSISRMMHFIHSDDCACFAFFIASAWLFTIFFAVFLALVIIGVFGA